MVNLENTPYIVYFRSFFRGKKNLFRYVLEENISMKILLAFCFDMKNVNDSSPISDREKKALKEICLRQI